ncbi:MAG: BrnA antitoxin family protein [Gammaproteobacteria bacterium]
MTDKDIDYSDIPETDEDFWKDAKIMMPKHKRQITLRIDDDIIEWFQKKGKGYQTKINAILRSYVDAHSNKQK